MYNPMKLVIKGTIAEATKAANTRGIFLGEIEALNPTQCLARCNPNQHKTVVMWFLDGPMLAPFPVGTLLWYSSTQREETDLKPRGWDSVDTATSQ